MTSCRITGRGPGEIIKRLRDPNCQGFSNGSILSAKYIANHSAQAKLLAYPQPRCAFALLLTWKEAHIGATSNKPLI
jgi:hypothetical protein